MPSNKTRNTLVRQWELLKLLPTRGSGKSAKELTISLGEAGYSVSKRQVERDLIGLQEVFCLQCNDASMPFGWLWPNNGSADLPGLTLAEALSLRIIEEALDPLLPSSVKTALGSKFAQAKSKLAALKGISKTARWADKVKTVQPALTLLPPDVNSDVLESIQTALLQDEQVEVRYVGNNLKDAELTLNPLGLIVRGAITYLVATAFKYEDVRLYAMHRIKKAKALYERVERPKGFDLSRYVDDGALEFGGGKPVMLHMVVSPNLARILGETPISMDQKISEKKNTLQLTATVVDSWQLRWWILSQGDDVTVLKPTLLTKEIYSTLKKAIKLLEMTSLEIF
jgi:predicted DNA-binding transcriptional regulator YafY